MENADQSQAWIRNNVKHLPAPGSLWRHYKGRLVSVLGIVVREESGRVAVAYKEENGDCWDRLLPDWRDTVHVDGVTTPRFVEVHPCTKSL